jgi:hypothetical protein
MSKPWKIRIIQIFERKCGYCDRVATFMGTSGGYCHTHVDKAMTPIGGWYTTINSTGWDYNDDVPDKKPNFKT